MAAEDWIPDFAFEDLYDDDGAPGYYRSPYKRCNRCGVVGEFHWSNTRFAVDGRVKEKWTLVDKKGCKHVCSKRDLDNEVFELFDDLTADDK